MSLDMQVRTESGAQAAIRTKMGPFELMTRVIGCESDIDRAALIGMTPKAVARARKGYVGSAFVANTITALRAHERELAARNLRPVFDELFEVVVVLPGPADAVTS